MIKSFLSLIIALLLFPSVLAQTTEGPGEKYALIIGIQGYPGFPEAERLKYADADALLFKNFIKTPEGGSFQEKNIRLLLNENGKRDDIYEKGLNWLRERVHRDDLVYLFFAGHGLEDPDDHLVYFMPYDGRKGAPDAMGIPSNTFLQYLKSKIDPRHLIVFIDACHAAAAATVDGTAREGTDAGASLNANWREIIKDQEAMNMAFFATSANQRSWEDNDLKHGVFTWFLIKGMKGEADRDKNGVVTAGELHLYLLESISEYTLKKFGREQTAQVSQKFNPKFPLAVFNLGDWYESGKRAYESKSYNEALTYFTKAIELNPQYQNAYIYRGLVKDSLGDKQGALADHKKAIDLDPKNAIAYINRGFVKSSLGDKQGALADYKKAIDLDPKNAIAYTGRGLVKTDLGDKQGALADYDKAIELDPKNADAYISRGNVKDDLGNRQGAIADHSKAIELDSRNTVAYICRGFVKSSLGDKQGALADYDKAIDLDPKNADAYYNRGIIKDALGDKEGVIADWIQAAKLGDEDARRWLKENGYYWK